MDEQEKLALEEMKAKCADIRTGAFNALYDLTCCSIEQLSHRGYKTLGDAMVGTFKFYNDKINRIHKEHLKKYPD